MSLNRKTLSQAKDYAMFCLKAKLVPYVASSPGMGKSSMFAAIAKELNLKMIDIRLAQEDPTTINGFPNVDNGRSKYLPPELFPLHTKDVLPLKPEHKGKANDYRTALTSRDNKVLEQFQATYCYAGWLVFFDELPSAPRAVQAACFKILLDRLIGQHPLHEKCYLAAAGNLSTDNAIVNELSTPLRSRIIHIHIESNAKDYINYAIKSDYDLRITTFLAYKNTAVNNFQEFNNNSSDETFCCERTWEFADRLIKQFSPNQSEPIKDEYVDLLCGTLGSTAIEFAAYTAAFKDLPTFSEIINNPTNTVIPEKPAVKFLLMGMLVGNATMDNIDSIMDYVSRFSKEYGFVFVKMLWAKDDQFLSNTKVENLFIQVANLMMG